MSSDPSASAVGYGTTASRPKQPRAVSASALSEGAVYSEPTQYEEFIDAGEQVIVVLSQRARGRASGVEVEFSYAQAWTVRKLVRMEFFPTRAEALAALGLGE